MTSWCDVSVEPSGDTLFSVVPRVLLISVLDGVSLSICSGRTLLRASGNDILSMMNQQNFFFREVFGALR